MKKSIILTKDIMEAYANQMLKTISEWSQMETT